MKLQIFTSILRDFYPGIKLAYICDEPIYFKWDDDKLFYPFKYYADICVPSKAGDLVQTDKTIDEIALDMVIMSPEMVMTLKESESGKISISIFVITEDWADDDYSGFNVWFTSDMASAKQKMNLAIKE